MIIIRCARCKRKIFRYVKIGKGKIWHCWKNRIVEDFSIHNGKNINCPCGTLIGVDDGKKIKMKQHAFIYSGILTK